jgi:hypothetical protein
MIPIKLEKLVTPKFKFIEWKLHNVCNYDCSFCGEEHKNGSDRWRDLYTYGFLDNLGRGVDYPFFNSAQYPYQDIIFRLIPEGINYNENLDGFDFSLKPLIDECE